MADGVTATGPGEEALAAAALEVANLLGFADLLPAFAAASAGEGDVVAVLGAIVRSIAADVFDIEPGGDRVGPAAALFLSPG